MAMAIEEAISHAREVSKRDTVCEECRQEHAQLADWLEELKMLRTAITPPNEPLTPEQLRKMDGQPVWVEFEDRSVGLWGIVHISVFEQIVFPDGLHCTIGQPYYGKIYKAYAYPPAHIDMEAWVSVEEKLPEPGERVLAANGSFVGEAYLASNGTWMRHDGFPWEVDCWMPMPDRRPPEGEA